jgi:hypothetical protein
MRDHERRAIRDYQGEALRDNRLDCREIVLTHMSADMPSRRDEADMQCGARTMGR